MGNPAYGLEVQLHLSAGTCGKPANSVTLRGGEAVQKAFLGHAS